PMSITPSLPDRFRRGSVFTWVNSQWKIMGLPGHFSAEINSRDKDRSKNHRPPSEFIALHQGATRSREEIELEAVRRVAEKMLQSQRDLIQRAAVQESFERHNRDIEKRAAEERERAANDERERQEREKPKLRRRRRR
ncbi:hypothetical protein QO034_23110, partial [Sedimentitalea sp. JM2-8]